LKRDHTGKDTTMNNPVDLLRGAIHDAAPNFAKVTTGHLDLPTPCDGWDLRTLLNHAYSRLDLSARAARNEAVDDFAQVEIDHVGDDPAGAFERLTAAVLTAWDTTDDLETPRVTPVGPMPPAGILLFGAQDIFVHAWDVATAIGATPELSAEMIEVFTRTHRESIDETMRAMFFADAVPVPDDAPPLDQLVAFLGRRPSATAPESTDRVGAV
jgi:uncharacterized protein (TIGR03086 family)